MKMIIDLDVNRLDTETKCHELKSVDIIVTNDDMKQTDYTDIIEFALHTLTVLTSHDTTMNTLKISVCKALKDNRIS